MQQIRNSYKVINAKYEKLRKRKMKDTGKPVGKVRLTQSSLLLLQPINPATDAYRFPVLDNDTQSPILPDEIRLNINDEFVSYDMGYYLVANTTHDTGGLGTPAGRTFFTYAPAELTSAWSAYFRAWLGRIQILVNKISRLENWDIKKHNIITRTQFQNSSAGIPSATQPSINFSDDGMFAMQPMVTLSGAKKSDILLQLQAGAIPAGVVGVWTPPTAFTISYAMSHLALLFRGMLAQNASKFQ